MRTARFFAAAAVAVALLAAPGAAFAEAPPEMVVDLADGTNVRGDVVEIVPGSHCTVVLADGRKQVLPWRGIRRIAPAGAPPLAPVAPPPAPPHAAAPLPPPPPNAQTAPAPELPAEALADKPSEPQLSEYKVFVSMTGSRSAQIRMSRPGQPWETMCTSPCDMMLPVDASYRIHDKGRMQSGFRLKPNASGTVVLDVSTSDTTVTAFGTTGIIVGSLMLYGASVSALRDNGDVDGGEVAVAVVGGIMLAVGIVALVSNRSSLSQSPGPTPGKEASTARRPLGGELAHFVRRTPTAPIFSIRF